MFMPLFSTEEKLEMTAASWTSLICIFLAQGEDKPENSSNNTSEKLTWGYVLRVMQDEKVTLLLQALPICFGFVLWTEEEVCMCVLDMNFL